MPVSFAPLRSVLVVCLSCATLWLASGCSNKDPEAAKIVANVDGEEINLRQLNALLARAQDVTPENIASVKADILGNLVEQQLAVNLALAKKLDRKADVANAIDASRREILARAALDQIIADAPKVGEEEAKRYYNDNPALFAERRIYTLQEWVFKKPMASADKIRAQLASSNRADAMAAWLKDKKLEFSNSSRTLAAEEIPAATLSKLQTYKDGQIGLFESHSAYTLIQVLSARAQPLSMPRALPAITALLENQHGTDAIKQAKLDMKASAKLEYFGEFAGGEAAFKAGTKVASVSAVEGDDQIEARAKAEAKIVEQGIKGL